MKICGQEFTEEDIRQIQAEIDAEPGISRRALSRRVCERLGWRKANGGLKDMSCRVALLKLERREVLRLPPGGRRIPCKGTGKIEGGELLGKSQAVSCALADLGGVELVLVTSRYSQASRLWRDLMDKHHYLGGGILCGAQIRYLIRNPRHGWLGGLGFSAAAWRVEARDRWIGWDTSSRERNLERVICNSRFLILPGVHVPHLASHVLGMCSRRIVMDWRDRYGIEPVLVETFVERARFRGTSYRAANWVYVGSTCGRGRQDRYNRGGKPIKDVYVMPLRADAREVLRSGGAEAEGGKPIVPVADWAMEEFGGANLSDARLRERLMVLAQDMYNKPQANIPQACGSRAKTKAAYRFFDHPETDMDTLLEAHYMVTARRAGGEAVVLAVQDTTYLNYSTHGKTGGLGPIGSDGGRSVGLVLHNTMAFNAEGTPLGLVDAQCWARDPQEVGKKHKRRELPIEQKESCKWLKSFEKAAELQRRCRETTVVSVGDREADIYELFKLAQKDVSGPKLLVRATSDRLLADEQGHVWDVLSREDVRGVQVVRVPRRGTRQAREAHLEVRFAKVRLKAPKSRPQLGEITIWALLAEEINAPDGVEPLKWMLLTTLPIADFASAVEKLQWYTIRWGIEIYHRTMKSGCKIEERQLGSADRLEACLAIDMVIAWRIFHLTKLGRETPDVPCTVFFEEAEWKALVCYKTQNPIPPEHPPALREAIRMVASLGGFLGRKCDGEPGTKSLWLGIQRLDDLSGMWKFMVIRYAPHLLSSAVSRPGYG